MKELLDRFNYSIQRLKKLPNNRELIKEQTQNYKKQIQENKDKIVLVQDSRIAYQKAIDVFYEQSIGQLEKLINLGLKQIFFDRSLQIKIELSNEEKKEKSFSFEVIDTVTGEPEDIRDGTGAGVRSVISFIILSYYLMQFNSPYIIADEAYSQISKDYVDGFFQFVHKLCEEENLTFILISHDERFIHYADQIIKVADGKIEVMKDLDDSSLQEIQKLVEEYNNEEKDKK